jgi:galactosylceramidase
MKISINSSVKFKGIITIASLLWVANVTGEPLKATPADTIRISGNASGRTFEGIGAVSAGASSRLLIDYPEPYRSDILDYLFKPRFGAGFTYLKTEIGGDGNSTCGSEPSFARTREEMVSPNYDRGYEYWLMKEAANRNPAIELDALEWSMPGWFTRIWSKDNADYLVKFIKGAQHWGLSMKYIAGCWNEREYNRDWIVDTLRPTLNRNGLANIKINAPEGAGKAWAICDELIKDTEFKNAIAAVSYHYTDSYMWKEGTERAGANAFNCGLPLWSGEDFSLAGKPWKNTTYLAKNILKCYIRQKIVKVNLWCPIASMPDNACFSNVGIMKGVSPWSGFYEVWPTIWAVAHFNQFVQPGWKFIDSGCGMLTGDGAYCTYMSPNGSNDYSIVIVNGTAPQKLTFHISDFSKNVLHVWISNSISQFKKQVDIVPVDGTFTISVDTESIYSITTTTGQQKGVHVIPGQAAFPTDYSDNFEKYSLKQAPLSANYFYDNSGAFELYQDRGESKCLRQMVDKDITHWIPDECAYTFIAQGTEWENGEISSDLIVEENAFNGTGYAGIIARGSYDKASQANIPFGYRLNIYKDGTWKLLTKTRTIASGTISANSWHRLKLICKEDTIQAYIDGRGVAKVKDNSYLLGAAGYVSGWNKAKYDNVNIKYSPIGGRLVSEWKKATCSSGSSEASNAFDGNSLSKWYAAETNAPQFLKVDLGQNYNITRCEAFTDFTDKACRYKIEYSSDNLKWHTLADKSANTVAAVPCYVDQNKVTGRWVRLTIIPAADKVIAGIYEFRIYSNKL